MAVTSGILVLIVPKIYIALASVRVFALEHNIWAIIFILVVLSVWYWPNSLIVNNGTTSLGRISFSLYLFHPLIIVFLYMYLNFYNRIGETIGTGGLGLLASATVTGLLLSLVSMFSL